MATAQSNTRLAELKDKKLLEYPIGIAKNIVDDHGISKQFMMFRIITDTKASKLKDDKASSDVLITSDVVGTGRDGQAINSKDADKALVDRYGQAAVNAENWRTQSGVTRLDKVIILPMPDDHAVNTSIQYDTNHDPSMLTKGADMAGQNGGALIAEMAKLGGASIAAGGINRAKSLITSKGGDATSTDAILASFRMAKNPKKEVMFNGFTYRQFSFSYLFAPKNVNESDTVNEIIRTFRYYALPAISPAKLFYIFPSEFEISFMLGKIDNPNIPRMTKSVLQRVGVNYSPASSGWATLPNGSPVAIQMTLEFIELELVDRNRVYNAARPISSGF